MVIQNIIRKKVLSLTVLLLMSASVINAQKTVRYDLYVRDTIVNFTGKEKRAIAVNGQIPMHTLTFTEGDTTEIDIHNELNRTTYWPSHG